MRHQPTTTTRATALLVGLFFFFSVSTTMVTVVHAAVPTAVVTAPSHASPTKDSPIDLVVTFSEKVTGFGSTGIPSSSELEITGGTFVLRSFYTGDTTVYYLRVTPSTAQGTLRVVALAGAATSVSTSEASLRSQAFELPYDSVKPTPVFTPSSSGAPSRVTPIAVTLTWDETVTGFDASPPGWLSRLTVGGGYVTSSSVNATSSPPTYELTVVPVPATSGAKTGTVTVAVAAGVATDTAGTESVRLVFYSLNAKRARAVCVPRRLCVPGTRCLRTVRQRGGGGGESGNRRRVIRKFFFYTHKVRQDSETVW